MSHSAVLIPRPEHTISRDLISQNALKVLYGLKDAGYDSFLVGGCVRDLLLGREPKDFDVVTNAHPEEIRAVFRNCRLIGRRFRLAHVRFGREVIEVATYRAIPQEEDDADGNRVMLADSGRILRDNVYGTREEDALRRDFTVNALYYNIVDFSVIDFAGGVSDLNAGLIRMIGDPVKRYREDPVRMLRAVRFSAKLGLRIEDSTAAPVFELAHLLQEVPPARLFEEVLKLFHGGYAHETFEQLRHYNLFKYIFPLTDKTLETEQEGFPAVLIPLSLHKTDERIASGLSVAPAFLFAVMLWGPVRARMNQHMEDGHPPQEALRLAAGKVIAKQIQHVSIPRRFTTMMKEIWMLQARLERRGGKRAFRLLEHERFRAAYDFLCLRSQVGEASEELCAWWTEFQGVDEHQQRMMVLDLPAGSKKRKRPQKRRRTRG